MDPAQHARLLRGLTAAASPSADTRAAATRALEEASDWPTAGDRLADLGLLTRYQLAKLRGGRPNELLFGPYLICDKIGEGGMGKVYRAVHEDTGKEVALKVVRPHLMANKVVQQRYAREAHAAASFDHPNIIKLLAEDTVDGRYYLAMEFVDGTDLSRLVKEFGKPPETGLPDPSEACEYVRQTALGLQHAHDRGFVHRDIKPSNLLAYGERPLPGTSAICGVKILDMGLVRRLLGEEDAKSSELTRDGTVVGTPDYMSPEQAKNSSGVDGRADLYSLGCTLYFLLHGRPPFEGGSPIDKLLKHHTEAAPDPRGDRLDVSDGLARVIAKLMEKKPADRYQTAAEVAQAIAPYCVGHAPPAAVAADDPYSLAPVNRPSAPLPAAAPAVGPAPVRQLRLKVKEPAAVARVPAARTDNTPSSEQLPAAKVRRSGPVSDKRTPTTDRLPVNERTPAAAPRPQRSRKPVPKRPIWPFVAVGVGAAILLGFVLVLLTRPTPAPTPPTPGVVEPPRNGPAPPPKAASGDLTADRANATIQLKPTAVPSRLLALLGPKGKRVADRLAGQGFAADKLSRVVVSLVGDGAVAAGDPGGVLATDPGLKAGLEARRSSGRPAGGLSADLLAAVRAAAEGNPAAGFAADGGFALPGGGNLAGGRLQWAAIRATPQDGRLAVELVLAGPDRATVMEFVSLELVGKLPQAVPALKGLCDRAAAADPLARRTDTGLELTFRFAAEWEELATVLEQVLPE